MTKQKTVTLNLTKVEAECLSGVFEIYMGNYDLNSKAVKPCMPFLKKLKDKIDSHKK